MAKVHDLFIVELAEVIKGYGNNPDDKDPFRLSEFYRFYELPNIAVSRENFEKMRPFEERFEKMRPFEERKTGKWIHIRTEADGNALYECSECHMGEVHVPIVEVKYCWNCGAKMEAET